MPDCEARKRLQVGGQAVIEGVMMRSPAGIATAVRSPDGRIIVRTEPFVSLTRRSRLFGLPVIRGAVALVETMVVAVKALTFSVEESGDGEKEKKKPSRTGLAFQMALTLAGALVLGLALFFYLPLVITDALGVQDGILFNLVDGLFRLLFIFLYIFAITRWSEMRRIFEYHGAEHKAIADFETGEEPTPGSAASRSRLHPRCSTSFLLIVVLVSVVVFIFLGRPHGTGDRLLRLALVPLIAGISYEILKASSRPAFRRWFGFVFYPGLMMQRMTTREPSPDQLEVAIAALSACLADNLLDSRRVLD